MGDFSSTFTIHNNLEVDLLVLQNGDPDHGYWLRWPNNGNVGLLSKSEQFQLKDNVGFEGTDGKIWIIGQRPDTGEDFKIGARVACPTGENDNIAVIWNESNADNLLLSIGGLALRGHPSILDIIIDRKI